MHKYNLRRIFGVAQTCDGIFCAEFFAYNTGNHVEFVMRGNRNKNIGIFYAGLTQYLDAGAVAFYDLVRQTLRKRSHNFASVFYYRYVIVVLRKVFRNGGAYFAVTYDKNFHFLFFSCERCPRCIRCVGRHSF